MRTGDRFPSDSTLTSSLPAVTSRFRSERLLLMTPSSGAPAPPADESGAATRVCRRAGR